MKKSYLDSLNLRPFEKRLVVVIGLLMFFVLNLWVVVPHFSDWGKVQFRMNKARRTLATFEAEVRQMPVYQARVRELGSENANVPLTEQQLHFANTREAVAAQAGVTISSAARVTTRTNQFFLELTQSINLLCTEEQLVTFLHNLCAGNSLIRVRDLSLRPDAPRHRLNAGVKLAASYQKSPIAAPRPPSITSSASPVRARTDSVPGQTAATMPSALPSSVPTTLNKP
jgi:hypothetical protein